MGMLYKTLFFWLLSTTFLNATDLLQLRKNYYLAVNDAKLTDEVYKMLVNIAKPTPIELGYLGGIEALRAKHSWNPYNKMKFLAKADEILKKAIAQDPNCIEIRFLRFSYQHYLPNMLGYSKEIKEDLTALISLIAANKYADTDKDLIKNIVKFLLESNRLNVNETDSMKRKIASL